MLASSMTPPPHHAKRTDALHLFVLCAFAVAQPLYDLLGRAPQFFVAHRAGPLVILSFALALSAGVPALLLLLEAATSRFGSQVRRHLHTTLVATLATLVILPLADRIAKLPAPGVIAVALLAGLASAAAYRRLPAARSLLTAISPAILIFPIVFVLFSPVRTLVLPAGLKTRPTTRHLRFEKPARQLTSWAPRARTARRRSRQPPACRWCSSSSIS